MLVGRGGALNTVNTPLERILEYAVFSGVSLTLKSAECEGPSVQLHLIEVEDDHFIAEAKLGFSEVLDNILFPNTIFNATMPYQHHSMVFQTMFLRNDHSGGGARNVASSSTNPPLAN